GVLVLRGALASADDRAGVSHTATRRRSLASNEADDRLRNIGFDEFGGALFGVAADFADHYDGMSLGIFVEHANGVEEGRPDDGIAADANARRLADAEARELINSFVG